jgi:hypothetical protein
VKVTGEAGAADGAAIAAEENVESKMTSTTIAVVPRRILFIDMESLPDQEFGIRFCCDLPEPYQNTSHFMLLKFQISNQALLSEIINLLSKIKQQY